MDFTNKPIEAISKFNSLGEITPLKIRLENDDQSFVTSTINSIIYVKDNNYAGINTIDYGCKICIEDREQLLELRYFVSDHKWTIRKVIY
ncbi:hypothetical protein [Cellulosilyticum sp. I15G10I2]|uniref:hypothetical protein n=1 Tax=Cellulosilyticum sp. I15G10I2 TaxID=1892843 RepID=UPI00085C4E23|nr:hypothetical protein [Cellulosilyticum sp. I15G10I2]